MECSICKNSGSIIKNSPANNGVELCYTCYREFTNMMGLMNKNNNSGTTRYFANCGTDSVKRWIEEVKKREQWWIDYFGGLAAAFTEDSYTDILVKPGRGPSIPAHKFLLATRSEVLKGKISDSSKTASIDSIDLPEFNHEELQTFLELIYCGTLAKGKFEMHYYRLALASHEYKIPHLEKYCEEHILELLDSSNALKVLEISEICSNETLRVAAADTILHHQQEVIASPDFEEYAVQNSGLMVHIIRHFGTQFQSKKQKT